MDCLSNFQAGRLLDNRFVTVSPLNHGSFGMVFLARDLESNDLVAIKCLTKFSAADSAACASGLAIDGSSDELAHHKRLGYHSNIVNLIHSFETDKHVYIVLEYCSQGDLYEAIRLDRGPLQTENVRDFMLQLVDAVEYIHSKGIFHRDIKPENIFLTHDGSMKLGDFGLATTDAWSYEACVGSDRYMAPEQYEPSNHGYSPAKADVWSIGVCLLNVLFSRNPFVTPTEDDVLFADFKRDTQSLFDVFPKMSQDTFEILTHAMAVDPSKRSLTAVREAILRVVSFTTDDEMLDDFCTENRMVVASSANREPLRTPSIQSPQLEQTGFPWAQALHGSTVPQSLRQLSTIRDNESYTEELFPCSEQSSRSWTSNAGQTTISSALDSALGTSLQSLAIPKRKSVLLPPPSDPVPITGSLPSRAAKPIPAMSFVFGKNSDTISKSWSDLWEEDEEAMEHERDLEERREKNARTWSQESKHEAQDKVMPPPDTRPRGLSEGKGSVLGNSQMATTTAATGDNCANFATESGVGRVANRPRAKSAARNSPPKKDLMDRWAELGNRRRAYQVQQAKESSRALKAMNWRRDWGLGSSGFDYGAWDKDAFTTTTTNKKENGWQSQDWRRNNLHSQAQRHADDVDESEWVGGWHDLHL